ncbi:pilus assembly protein PilY [Cupriavidus sp. CuC1]|uniref:pilus assembly protein PilY n=1 Tax=Cupriavidus sp. CuC1 TaxID=3373131 RepID=UPI0037D933B8
MTRTARFHHSLTALAAGLLLAGTAQGARSTPPVLVPPPAWMPGWSGHAEFVVQHGARAALVRLGMRDGLLHAFDARSGEEVLAYRPRALLKRSAAPCPYPEAADVSLESGRWRTVLLCGLPAPATGTLASVFVLDITNAAAQPPLEALWEANASDALPLAPSGPVRALALSTLEGPSWYAMVMLASAHGRKTRPGEPQRDPPWRPAGIAMLPLGKPAQAPWQGPHAILRLHLPASGCRNGEPSLALLAASILPDAAGVALAAYAVDTAGGLWRFDLRGAPPWHDGDRRVRCIHRAENPVPLPAPSASAGAIVPPVLISASGGHLVVYGHGERITAVFDSTALSSTGNTDGSAARIAAQPHGGGVVLRRQPHKRATQGGAASTAGWHLPLPNPGERLDRFLPADPGYLGFVTRTPDARQRAYLIHALSGESTTSAQAGGPLAHVATGLGASAIAAVVLQRTALPPERSAQPGTTSREAVALTLWSLEEGSAVPLNRTIASRRTGRLSWRELIRTGPP